VSHGDEFWHIEQRHGTAELWTERNPVLNDGEVGWETDTLKQKLGDGVTTWDQLPYAGNELSWVAEAIQLWQYGNSYAAYTINSSTTYFDRLIQKLRSPVHGNWGIPSTLAADQCSYMYGTFTAAVQFAANIASSRTTGPGTWTQNANASLGTNGVVILECVRNDAGLDAVTANGGTTAKSRAGFRNAVDSMIRKIRFKSLVENNNVAWTYSAGWANAAGFPGLSGSNRQITTTPGATGTITIGGDSDLILVGVDDSGLGLVGSEYEVRVDGDVFAEGTTSDQTRKTGFTSGLTAGGNYGFGQMAVPLRDLSAGNHTVEIEHTGTAGDALMIDVLLAPRDGTDYPPPTIIVPKNPEFTAAGYQSYIDLGGTNASRATDLIYNAIIDDVIAQFGDDSSVVTWDPMEHGFDPTIHIGNKDGANVHLNDRGAAFYAEELWQFINALPPRDGLVRT
jgi:hypothetical protein